MNELHGEARRLMYDALVDSLTVAYLKSSPNPETACDEFLDRTKVMLDRLHGANDSPLYELAHRMLSDRANELRAQLERAEVLALTDPA